MKSWLLKWGKRALYLLGILVGIGWVVLQIVRQIRLGRPTPRTPDPTERIDEAGDTAREGERERIEAMPPSDVVDSLDNATTVRGAIDAGRTRMADLLRRASLGRSSKPD